VILPAGSLIVSKHPQSLTLSPCTAAQVVRFPGNAQSTIVFHRQVPAGRRRRQCISVFPPTFLAVLQRRHRGPRWPPNHGSGTSRSRDSSRDCLVPSAVKPSGRLVKRQFVIFLLVKTDCGFDPRGARGIFCRAVQTYETIVPTIDWEFSTWTFKSQKNSWILRYYKNAVKFNTTLLRCRKNNFFASADFKILHSRPYKAALTTVAVTSCRA